MFSNGNNKKQKGKSIMRIPKKFLVLLCTVALIASLVPMTALAAPAYNSSIVSNTIPATMTPGQVVYAKIVVKNTGANTWTAARGIQLKETDSLKLLPYAYKLAKTDSIKAGQSKTFTVKITAPATAGTYNLSLKLYRNSTAFGATLTKAIVVKSAVKTLASIAVTTQPTKLEYVKGEGLDLTGLVVTGTYSDGSKAPVAIVAADITGYNKDTVGEQTLTITKSGKTTTFKVTVKAAGVVSVKAISATKVLVKFNVEMDKGEAQTGAKYSITGATLVADPKGAVLQADKKSVILTTAAPISGTTLYVINPILFAGSTTAKSEYFTAMETYKDTVGPVVSSVEYPTYDTVKINFSEPIGSLGNVSFVQNGKTVVVTEAPAFVAGDSSVTYTLVDASVKADLPIIATYVGLRDVANPFNLTEPNPLTVTFKKTITDTTAPSVVSVKALSTTKVEITFSEKLSANPVVTAGPAATGVDFPAYDPTKDNKVFVGTLTGGATLTGINAINVAANYTDLSGNKGAAFIQLVVFANDSTPPAITSIEVATIGGKQKVVIHYSEDLADLGAGKAITLSGTRTSDYVTYDFNKLAPASNSTLFNYTKANGCSVDDLKSVMFDIDSNTTFPAGAYSISLPAAFVADTAAQDSKATTITFTKSSSVAPVDTGAPKVDTVSAFQNNNTTLDVTFSENVDPTSALTLSNYKIGGLNVFASAQIIGNAATSEAKVVRLTLTPGQLTMSGYFSFVITGVKDKAGNVMTPYSSSIDVDENIKPYLASAQLTSATQITLTFSEALGVVPVVADFEVYVNGAKVTIGAIAAPTTSTVTLTIPAITDIAANVQVKPVGTAITDANGNLLVPGALVSVSIGK